MSTMPLKRYKDDYYCRTVIIINKIEDFAREKGLEAIWQ